jgi:hypothetical protein
MTDFGPIFIVLAILGVLAGFFKHLFVRVLGTLIVLTGIFVVFPQLLIQYAQIVSAIRQALS